MGDSPGIPQDSNHDLSGDPSLQHQLRVVLRPFWVSAIAAGGMVATDTRPHDACVQPALTLPGAGRQKATGTLSQPGPLCRSQRPQLCHWAGPRWSLPVLFPHRLRRNENLTKPQKDHQPV